MFQLTGARYTEVNLSDLRFWIPEIELGLGVWQSIYKNINMLWLRWYDKDGNWVLTPTEQERQKSERLILQLRVLGVEPDLRLVLINQTKLVFLTQRYAEVSAEVRRVEMFF